MLKVYNKYLGENVTVQERLFSLAAFMTSVTSLIYVAVLLFFNTDIVVLISYSCVSLVSAALFFLNGKLHRPALFSVIFLTIVNVFLFPSIMYVTYSATVEVPMYMIIGLTFTLVLLSGKLRFFMFALQMIVDLSMSYYCFVLRDAGNPDFGNVDTSQYVRLGVSIMTCGVLCGITIAYRNVLLSKEFKVMEEENSKAKDISFAKDMFLVNVSHEIRTPLNAIIGETELLLDSDLSNKVKEMASSISNSSHALLSITTDLLDFSRLNINNVTLENNTYDLAEMLNEIINLMSVRLLDSNVDFYVDVDPKICKKFFGDSGKIRQVLVNLLSNGIKYTKEGYVKFAVSCENANDYGADLIFKVEDTGIGISQENFSTIFEPYYYNSNDTSDKPEGNGLGLPLCEKLATIMGGIIEAQSEEGKGSIFTFKVNQIKDPELTSRIGDVRVKNASVSVFIDNKTDRETVLSVLGSMNVKTILLDSDDDFTENVSLNQSSFYIFDSSAFDRTKDRFKDVSVDFRKFILIGGGKSSYSDEPFEFIISRPLSCLNISDALNKNKSYFVHKQSLNGRLSLEGARVMVVDDNSINLSVAEGLLLRYGPEVILAGSGKEAINIIADSDMDIVFLDYMMPEMDGIDTLKNIRNLPGERFKDVPVIALTANAVSGAREMFLSAGFDDYLSKPIETDALEKILKTYMPDGKIKFYT